jgi:hypothetical protein
MVLSLLLVLIIIVALLAIFDGISRLRGRGSGTIVGVLEIILGALLLISQFVPALAIVAPWFWSALLEIVLVIAVIVRGRGRAWIATIIALILNTVLLLVLFGWLTIPGLL